MTFFAGRRDSYQLPLALAEAGCLEAFVTDSYWPFENPLWGSLVRRCMPPRLRNLRHVDGLPSNSVRIAWRALAGILAMRIRPGLPLDGHVDDALGETGRRIAARTSAAVFACSYYAHSAFREGPDRPRERFLFQIHPHPASVRALLTDELERCPWAEASLRNEAEMNIAANRLEHLSEEPQLANGWVVASSYTASTLIEHGIPADKVHVVPYGVDVTAFPRRKTPRTTTGPLEVVFLGSMVQRKGLSYLLEAFRQLNTREIRLTLVGRGFLDQGIFDRYRDVPFVVRRSLPHDQLIGLLHESDVFVLPSLVEGFGQVLLEAMSAGLPVITTPHTCAPDLVQNGREGWIVPVRSAEAIAERLAWCADHRADVAAMGEAAAALAERTPWSGFRSGIVNAYRKMLTAVDT